MKCSIYLLLFSFLIVSCNDGNVITEVVPEEKRCNLEVFVYECPDIYCVDRTTENQFSVSIYATHEDALQNANQIVTGTSDEDGRVYFYYLPCDIVYVRIASDIYGTYINSQSLSTNTAVSYHNVRFVNGFIYTGNDMTSLRQGHISLANPIVGQQSFYRYHYEESTQAKFSITEYTGNMLSVQIVAQIDDHTFVVEEKVDTLVESRHYPVVEQVMNIWRFEHDSLYIEAYEEEFKGSFVWGMHSFANYRMSRFSVGLSTPTFNELDMNGPYSVGFIEYSPNGRWGSGHVLDYTLFGHLYDMLILDFDINSGVDGYDRFNIFSKEDGVVRSMQFFPSVNNIRGFDLLIE